jgi:hypothetical protein
VIWLLREGEANIRDVDNDGNSALICAAECGHGFESIRWLLEEGESSIGNANNKGWTAMLATAGSGKLATIQYLWEHGGANIGDRLDSGKTIWDLLAEYLIEDGRVINMLGENPYVYDVTAVTSLLRVMVLRGVRPAKLTARLTPEHAQVFGDGARLRAGLPAYLARQRAS